MGSRTRGALALALVTVFLTLVSIQAAEINWGTYHRDAARLGINDSVPPQMADNIGLIWTFPRLDVVPIDEEETIVDMVPTDSSRSTLTPPSAWDDNYSPAATWAGDFYGDSKPAVQGGFYWARSRTTASARAQWFVPARLVPDGTRRAFQVQVWFPSTPTDGTFKNTRAARYTVSGTTCEIDQTHGGQWIDLRPEPFMLGPGNYVELSNRTEDAADDVLVCADAVRFVPSTGMEMYSSPAAGKASVAHDGSEIPAAWIGTIESPVASLADGVKDFGAVYCVRSYTGAAYTGGVPIDWADPEVTGVGTPVWRYPAGGAYDSSPPSARLPVEGPIGRIGSMGGVLSSPTLVMMPDGVTMVAIVGGMDGQVYCLNATDGNLIWKGPGVTISEPATPMGWSSTVDRQDAFGGSFIWNTIVKEGDTSVTPSSIVYDIPANSDPGQDASLTDGSGHMYTIYAWMPAQAGTPARTKDAAYKITYFDPSTGGQKTDTVRVDQSGDKISSQAPPQPGQPPVEEVDDDPNVGKWARVGGSYWNPSKIELTNASVVAANDSNYEGRAVVADAIMVVPDGIGAFSYSTAVSDGTKVYIGNTNGRVYALQLSPYGGGGYTTKLDWTFPQVQTKNPVTDMATDGAAPPAGEIVASPTFYPEGALVLAPSTDGKVYALDVSNGSVKWVYNSANDGTSTSSEQESFTSSAAIRNRIAYVPSTAGRMHAIKLDEGGERQWLFPNRGGTDGSEVPFPAFRFSTPSVDGNRVLGASGGGIIHGISTSTLPPTPDASFAHPNFWAPVQSSPALDPTNLFIGTLGTGDGDDGGLWWVNRLDGTPPAPDAFGDVWGGWGYLGMVFSSPAVANDYVYVGTGKGRLCAFSSTAFGGAWVGGPEGSRPPGRRSQPPNPLSEDSAQVDVFSSAVYEATLAALKYYSEADPTTGEIRLETTNSMSQILSGAPVDPNELFARPGWSGGKKNTHEVFEGHQRAYGSRGAKGDREVFMEWGEEICLIAWNINPLDEIEGAAGASEWVGDTKRNAIRFRFVNASAGAGSGGTIPQKTADLLIQYTNGDGEKRCLAMKRFPIDGDSRNPPSPGSGWSVSTDIQLSRTSRGARVSATPAIVPLLQGNPGSWTVAGLDAATQTWGSQPIGINSPLAISTGSGAGQSIAWPQMDMGTGLYIPNPADQMAHVNGNGALTTDETGKSFWNDEFIPTLYLGPSPHGANSPIAMLGAMDRSATGLMITAPATATDPPMRGKELSSFRLQPGDLHWRGGADAVWKSGGIVLPWDYPPELPMMGYTSRLQRDYPDISRRMEFFQKAPENNDPSVEKTALSGALPKDPNITVVDYLNCRLRADNIDTWVQVPQFQPANTSPGYSTTVIAYLDNNSNGRFDSGVTIAGRPTTYIETYRKFKLSLEVPPDYHMVVERPLTIDITGPDRALAPHGLGIGVEPTKLTDWYKQFTVRNLGNVNLPNIKIGKSMRDSIGANWPLNLYAENVSPFFALSGLNIVSSLDGWDPNYGWIDKEPYATWDTQGRYLGYTLSKTPVGRVNPTMLTLPDSRKCEEMDLNGIMPSVSVQVPLTQPTGSYHQQVPVFADFDGDNILKLPKVVNNVIVETGEPYSDPTFRLNVVVAENRMTGGPTPGSAPQIDPETPAGETPIICGNTQPTAWRDDETGDVHVFWSSNRFVPVSPTQNDPWYIAHAALRYDLPSDNKLDRYSWAPQGEIPSLYWWETPPPENPGFQLPGFDWPNPQPAGLIDKSVKHSAPYAAVNPDSGKVWLFWQGQADAKDDLTGKIERRSLIFYTPATEGRVAGDDANVISFARDVFMPKMNPRAACYNSGTNENMWLTWYGGESGRWSLFGNLNSSPADSHNANGWSPDIRFITPTCLVSMADPSPVHRKINQSDKFLDLAYTGTTKYDQSADVVLTRYQWSNDDLKNPKVDPVLMPRVYNEELLRDPKKNVYTSEHLAWIRPPNSGMIDAWDWNNGRKDRSLHKDSAFIRVVLPPDEDGEVTEISGTDGSVSGLLGTQAGVAIAPQIDRATGTYTYDLTGIAKTVLGQMIVDFSAGIVRFTNALPPKTKVYADYTPQSVRLTRGQEHDSSPYMFLEKTEMVSTRTGLCPNPGLVVPSGSREPNPTDRYWFFWRKATSGVGSSTIYYKTYRIAATLDPKQPVGLSTEGRPSKPVTVTNALGPCEVSWDGKKIYFTAIDERYPGLPGSGLPVEIEYTPKGASQPIKVTFDTLTWEEELSETALPTRQNVNEGQITAFADPGVTPTKIWVFWSSTRAGETDLYYQTISPNFKALY